MPPANVCQVSQVDLLSNINIYSTLSDELWQRINQLAFVQLIDPPTLEVYT